MREQVHTQANPSGNTQPILCDIEANPAPEGARAGYFLTRDKVKLRYALWPKTKGASKGTICLVQGRAEFIEKYYETITEFQARGFNVATFDWRGQGGSDRLTGNRKLGYVDTFEDYLTDIRSFHESILLPDCPPPYYLVGHSMGGLVSLMAGAQNRLMFDRIFLSSPMLALENMPFSMANMGRVADTLCFAGLGQLTFGRQSDRVPSEKSFPGNALTSDFYRYNRALEVLKHRPDLQIGAPSVRWLAAAFKAMAQAAHHDFPTDIKVPVIMLAGVRDEVVSTPAIEHLGLSMRTGRHAVLGTARHELFMENDDIRAQVFAAFDAFITDQTV